MSLHGNNPRVANAEFAFAQKILDYARYSLLIFLVLATNKNILEMRDDIIKTNLINSDGGYDIKSFINEYLIYNAVISNGYDDSFKELLGDISWIKDLEIDYIEPELPQSFIKKE